MSIYLLECLFLGSKKNEMKKEENPLYYFEKLLVKTQEEYERITYAEICSLPNFIEEDKNIKGRLCIASFDDTGKVIYEYTDVSQQIEFTFNIEAKVALEQIKKDILYTTKSGNSPQFYIKEIEKRLYSLEKEAPIKFSNYPILEELLRDIRCEITDKSINITTTIDIEDYCEDSFDWNKIKQEDKILFVKKIYQLLMENSPIISASEEDFINAFTQKKVDNGIKWLLKSKNGKTSKTSLFYFIDELRNNNLLTYFEEYSFGRKVEYVFRDCDGNPFSNISQSLNYYRERKSCDNEETIDNIIFQLEQP